MKKTGITLLFFLVGNSIIAQNYFGIHGAAGISGLNSKIPNSTTLGLDVGTFWLLRLTSQFYLSPSIYYSRQGGLLDNTDMAFGINFISLENSNNFLKTNLLCSYFLHKNKINMLFEIGPYMGLLVIRNQLVFYDSFVSYTLLPYYSQPYFDTGISARIGRVYQLSNQNFIFLKLSCDYGLKDIIGIQGRKISNYSFTIGISYVFRMKMKN